MTRSLAPDQPPSPPAEPDAGPRYRDARELADHVLGLLTLDEKISLLHSDQPALPRVGLASFHTGGEVLHGVRVEVPCTVFPQAVGLGASWDPDLLERIGDAIGSEVDSLLQRDRHAPLVSRNVWSPVVNLLRDPRWGRNEEGYSEDPGLTSSLAVAFCSGLRGAGPGERPARWRIVPTLKHFVAYNHETDKFARSMDLRPRVLHEYDMVPFLEPVRAGVAAAVMPSYHLLNGRPNHLSEHLRLLRLHDPDLAVVSDGFAPSDIIDKSRYYEDREHAYPAAMRAGLDSFTDHCGDPTITVRALRDAVARGLLTEAEIDAAARRLLLLRARAGDLDTHREPVQDTVGAPAHRALAREAVRRSAVLLRNDGTLPLADGPGQSVAVIGPLADRCVRDWYGGPLPYRVTPVDGIRARAGDTVVYESGLDRITLRHRGDGRLLAATEDGGVRLTDVTGSDDTVFEVFDWGEGGICLRSVGNGMFLSWDRGGELPGGGRREILRCDREEPFGWEIRQTFRLERAEADGPWVLRNVYSGRYAATDATGGGLDLMAPDAGSALALDVEVLSLGAETAARAAGAADRAVVLVGTYPQINGMEGHDRKDTGLPSGQSALARAVIEANPRTAVVLVSGHPLSVTELAERAPALMWTSHGGQEFGNGLADLLFGDREPTGRLPQSWPRSANDLGDILGYDIIKSRLTYLYSDREPLFPFGHGLGYTDYRLGPSVLDRGTAAQDEVVTVSAELTNTGARAGEEVAQLYVRALDSPVPRPLRQLHGFRRVSVAPGARERVEFRLPVRDLAYWDVGRGRFTVAPGRYALTVARSAAAAGPGAVLTVVGEPLPPRDLGSRLVRAVDFDDYHAVRLTDQSPTTGEAVTASGPGSWLLFRDVLIARGHTGMVLRLGGPVRDMDAGVAPSGGAAPPGRLEIRLGDPAGGRLVAVAEIPGDDTGRYSWRTVTVPLAPADGRHDVYLVFTGAGRLASLGLTAAESPEGHR